MIVIIACRYFQSWAEKSSLSICWNYMDVYNKFRTTAEQRLQDASSLCQFMLDRHEHGFPAFFDVNSLGQLSTVFFVLEGALDWWAINQDAVSFHYDTTFGTNRVGMKLGLGNVVDADGHTKILFVSLVAHQDSASFEWVFQKMLEVFRISPKVVFTDSDPALALAIKAVLTTSLHLLCTWHLSLNLATNVGAFAARLGNWFERSFGRSARKQTSSLGMLSIPNLTTLYNSYPNHFQVLPPKSTRNTTRHWNGWRALELESSNGLQGILGSTTLQVSYKIIL